MRFDEAVARLSSIPDILPPPSDSLAGSFVDGADEGIEPRPSFPDPGPDAVAASVLVLLYPDHEGIARVVLTERVSRDGHHSGEVSFPGGRAEDVDADEAATALREAYEEVGLDAAAAGVRVVGRLESFWIPVSNFRVTPVLAVAERRPVMEASPAEVARILEPPLSAFLPDAPVEFMERTFRGWRIRFGAYPIEGLQVWGATARVLSQLGALLAASDGQSGSPSVVSRTTGA
jgi:8-oxo-dGTP pyrophosphatase MutT (NUDIX family)